jgi:DNA repair protein RadC
MPTKTSPEPSDTPLRRRRDGRYWAIRPLLSEDEILAAAETIIERRFRRLGKLASTADTRQFLRAKLVTADRERFGCLFLDHQHQVIAWEVLFQGTLDTCSVHPREVVKRALFYNSSAVILAHQHPSGDPEPSASDRRITRRLRDALEPVGIRVLDHIIVGARGTISMTQRGLL